MTEIINKLLDVGIGLLIAYGIVSVVIAGVVIAIFVITLRMILKIWKGERQ